MLLEMYIKQINCKQSLTCTLHYITLDYIIALDLHTQTKIQANTYMAKSCHFCT